MIIKIKKLKKLKKIKFPAFPNRTYRFDVFTNKNILNNKVVQFDAFAQLQTKCLGEVTLNVWANMPMGFGCVDVEFVDYAFDECLEQALEWINKVNCVADPTTVSKAYFGGAFPQGMNPWGVAPQNFMLKIDNSGLLHATTVLPYSNEEQILDCVFQAIASFVESDGTFQGGMGYYVKRLLDIAEEL